MYKQLKPYTYTALHDSIASVFLCTQNTSEDYHYAVKEFKTKQQKKKVRWHLLNNTLIKREELDDVLTKQEL